MYVKKCLLFVVGRNDKYLKYVSKALVRMNKEIFIECESIIKRMDNGKDGFWEVYKDR